MSGASAGGERCDLDVQAIKKRMVNNTKIIERKDILKVKQVGAAGASFPAACAQNWME